MNKLIKSILPGYSFELLKSIQNNHNFDDFYLAGGTALSLILGHRKSVDLDFFTPVEFKSNIIHKVNYEYQVIGLHDNSIEIIAEKTKVMFFYFAYPLHNKLSLIDGIRLADPIDIGLMKLLALQGRSSRKDVIDLWIIDKEIMSLEKLLALFDKIYPDDAFNKYDSLKNLLDPDSLEKEPMPLMNSNIEWNEIYNIISSKIINYIKLKINV